MNRSPATDDPESARKYGYDWVQHWVVFAIPKITGLAPFVVAYLFVPSPLTSLAALGVTPLTVGAILTRMLSPVRFVLYSSRLECRFLFRTSTYPISEITIQQPRTIGGLAGALAVICCRSQRCCVYEALEGRDEFFRRLNERGAVILDPIESLESRWE